MRRQTRREWARSSRRRAVSRGVAIRPASGGLALAALTAVYALNLVDRGLVAILLEPIKHDLKLSDTQLGFLTGIAFGLFYALIGLPIARWADRGDRVTITSISIASWGLTVMACVWVANFTQLLLARIAAAIGEAGCKPPTYALVGDYFPAPAQRIRAMSVYWLGSPLAALLSYALGGWLNERFGWRMTFFLMGIPGLLLAIFVKFFLEEPRKVGSACRVNEHVPTMKAVMSMLWAQPSLRHLSLGLVLFYTMAFGMAPWYAAFIARSHDMGTAELGAWLGGIFGISGCIGILGGGVLTNHWFDRNERGQVRMSAVAFVMLVPCFGVFVMAPGKYAALAALVPLQIIFSIFYAPIYALMQRLVPDTMRATALSVVMLFANLIGMGVGPQLVGVLSDLLAPTFEVRALGYAILGTSLIALWAGHHFWQAGETVAQDLAIVGRLIGPTPTMHTPSIRVRV